MRTDHEWINSRSTLYHCQLSSSTFEINPGSISINIRKDEYIPPTHPLWYKGVDMRGNHVVVRLCGWVILVVLTLERYSIIVWFDVATRR
jgi:hypothetical protein